MNSRDGDDAALASSDEGQGGSGQEGGEQKRGELDARSDSDEVATSQQQAGDQDQDDIHDIQEDMDQNERPDEAGAADDAAAAYQNDELASDGDGSSRDQRHADGDNIRPPLGQTSGTMPRDDSDLHIEPKEQRSPDAGHSQKPDETNRDTLDPDVDGMNAEQLRELVYQMRQDHEQQLQAEERARSEVEDMCLRIEKHFKAEKAARAKAEELMQQAIENELGIKSQLDMEHQRLSQVENDIEFERDKLRQERDALEVMRVDFEHELQQAQAEVAKAQDALKTAEDRVRAVEQVERQKIISDYEMRLMALANELVRANNETQLRTSYMSREVARYQAAAAASANAMALAKREMHDRRADVDAMRTNLDSVMERLFAGSQANMVLQANMSAGQDHAGQLFADPQAMTTAGLATLMPGAKLDAHALTQPLLLGATTHARPGKNAAGGDVGAAFGKLSVMDADAMAPGAYSGHTTKAPRGGAAAGTAKAKGVSKRGGGDGSSGNANKSRQLPPLQSNTPAPQAHPRRHSDLMPRAAGPATTKTTRRKAPAGAPDRFHGTQVRNEYIMAETMANW